MAFSMSSIYPAVEKEVDDLKRGMSELQKLSTTMDNVERNQNDLMKKMDDLINIMAKFQMN